MVRSAPSARAAEPSRSDAAAGHETHHHLPPLEDPGPRRAHWWVEILIIATFYGLYTVVRDLNGNKPVSVDRAYTNAHRIISLEQHLSVFREAAIQHAFIHDRDFLRFWDGYYGTVHFLAVIGVLVYLFFWKPHRYRLWRNTMAAMTGLALLGFYFFPMLPPRLLPDSYGFTDTLRVIGGLWDFQSGAVDHLSNQFAAMPSLHTGWSTWCALAVMPSFRHWWAKAALLLYPLATVFCIIVTANHYFADAVGGLVALAAGYGVARISTALYLTRKRRARAGPPGLV